MPAIETLAQRIASSEGLTVETNIALALEDSERLAPDVESTVYRVVQEALTNVAKHAAATRLEIELLMEGDAVAVTVRDDGRGFDPAAPATGFGLVGMRERVTLVSGEVTRRVRGGKRHRRPRADPGPQTRAAGAARRRQAG